MLTNPATTKQIVILIGIILAVGTYPEAIGQVQPLIPAPLEKTPQGEYSIGAAV